MREARYAEPSRITRPLPAWMRERDAPARRCSPRPAEHAPAPCALSFPSQAPRRATATTTGEAAHSAAPHARGQPLPASRPSHEPHRSCRPRARAERRAPPARRPPTPRRGRSAPGPANRTTCREPGRQSGATAPMAAAAWWSAGTTLNVTARGPPPVAQPQQVRVRRRDHARAVHDRRIAGRVVQDAGTSTAVSAPTPEPPAGHRPRRVPECEGAVAGS